MTHPHTTRFSTRLRLLCGLALLLGLCIMLGGLARPAHAYSKFSVTNCSSDAQLQSEVAQANHDNAGDVITFACSGDIKLSSTLNVTGNMTLSGSGQQVTLDGGNSVQVLSVKSVKLTLKTLTIAHGLAPFNGSDQIDEGGGLLNDNGTVSISNSTFANNSATIGGGGIANGDPYPGYNFKSGTVSISQSTFSGNSTLVYGGGLYSDYSGTVSISSSTFAYNSSNDNGGGLITSGIVSISGSIVAANTGGDCGNYSSITDNGYNLSSDSSCSFTGTGSVQNSNPKLGPLASNGGPTQTLALLKGSPAMDVIPLASGLCPATDQRGHKRPDSSTESACDIGAYES